MIRDAIIEELETIITDYLKNQNLELVDLIYRYEGRNLVLRILTDRPEGGITLDECASINNDISRILDEKDLLQQRYILEVSSPGLDRPLNSNNDFLRCINRAVKVFLSEAIDGKLEWDGIIGKVIRDSVYIEARDKTIEIPLSKITKAKQIIKAV
jgi:ribosome maturation factor RimP